MSKEVSYDQFQAYVDSGYVNKVVGYDDNSVEFYINAQCHCRRIQGRFYKGGERIPMITTEAPSRESLDTFLAKEKELKQKSYNLPKHFERHGKLREKEELYVLHPLEHRIPYCFILSISGWIMRMYGRWHIRRIREEYSAWASRRRSSSTRTTSSVSPSKMLRDSPKLKQEVEEIVEFLKEPQKYTEFGR
jgi:cell division protease FtsH